MMQSIWWLLGTHGQHWSRQTKNCLHSTKQSVHAKRARICVNTRWNNCATGKTQNSDLVYFYNSFLLCWLFSTFCHVCCWVLFLNIPPPAFRWLVLCILYTHCLCFNIGANLTCRQIFLHTAYVFQLEPSITNTISWF